MYWCFSFGPSAKENSNQISFAGEGGRRVFVTLWDDDSSFGQPFSSEKMFLPNMDLQSPQGKAFSFPWRLWCPNMPFKDSIL